MAFWNELNYKSKKILTNFGLGINQYNDAFALNYNELTDSLNLCADNYPICRTRNDRVISSLPQSTKALYGLGQRAGTQVHVLEDVYWKYGGSTAASWTNISTAVPSPANANFIEYNTETAKYTILAYSTGTVYNMYWDGATLSTFADTNCPRSNMFTSHRYRLYGIESNGRTLKYSAQGLLTNWTLLDDAGDIDITEIKGGAVAITTFADHPIIWGYNSMHEVYGTGPDNFELVNISNNTGIVSRNAYIECDGKLFWMDFGGIYMYTGGLPRQVGYKANGILGGINWDYKHLICAGSVQNKIYFAVPYKSTTNNLIIVMDILEGKGNVYAINKEDGAWFGFTRLEDQLFGLRNDGYIFDMHSTQITGMDNSTAITWSLETRPFVDELNLETAVKDIWVEHSGSTNRTMNIGFTTNDNSTTFTSLGASSDFYIQNYALRDRFLPSSTQLSGSAFMKFNLNGTGQTKISAMQINMISYGDQG